MGFPIWVHTWRNNATGHVYDEASIFSAEQEYRPTLTLVSSRLRGDETGPVVNPYTVEDLIAISTPAAGSVVPNPFVASQPSILAPAPAPAGMGIQTATPSPLKAGLSGVGLVSAVAFLFRRG